MVTNKFGEILYIDTIYRPEVGSFCKPRSVEGNRYKAGNWYYCRDLFHGQLYNLRLFFFYHNPSKGHCVASFMKKIEDVLNVEPRSKFGPTQRKTIMWIEPSRWWTVKAMRRSLFTILLRVGCKYIPCRDNFEEALFSDTYTLSTKYAIQRFFLGNTNYTGKKRGWYKQFSEERLTEEEINILLIDS